MDRQPQAGYTQLQGESVMISGSAAETAWVPRTPKPQSSPGLCHKEHPEGGRRQSCSVKVNRL